MTQLALVFTIPTTTISARKSKIARQISSTIKFEGAPMIARPSIARLADSVPVALDLFCGAGGATKGLQRPCRRLTLRKAGVRAGKRQVCSAIAAGVTCSAWRFTTQKDAEK
jgi:hypothetical protein